MTVRELGERMDSRELSEWIAYTRHFEAIPDPWRQTAKAVCATLAPHCRRGAMLKEEDFVPIEPPPQHPEQMRLEVERLRQMLGGG
jgi:hypothetical protein